MSDVADSQIAELLHAIVSEPQAAPATVGY
jgi:hypothetical protein